MAYPITGSLTRVRFDNEVVAYATGLKIDAQAKFTPVRVLGSIFIKTFVIDFVTITGVFSVHETKELNSVKMFNKQVDIALDSSAPTNKTFTLEPADGNGGFGGDDSDAPTYVVKDVVITRVTPEVTIDGNTLSSACTFVGRKIEALD